MSLLATSPRERILKLAQKIPASAQILSQLGRLLMDINSGLDDIAELLKRDTSLSARLLRVSNSVAFSTSERIASIEEAVNRVGFTEVYRYCGLAAASQIFDQDLAIYGIPKGILRANTLFTALASENLAKRAGIDAQAAYSAGLLRSTGKVVLDQLAKDHAGGVVPFAESGQASVIAWEGMAYGMTNAAVASMILEEWKFPNSVVVPVRDQYRPDASDSEFAPTSLVVNLAAGLAAEAGFVMPGEATDWELSVSKLSALDVSRDSMDECLKETQAAFDKVNKGMNAPVKSGK